jgi:hypothetical protein
MANPQSTSNIIWVIAYASSCRRGNLPRACLCPFRGPGGINTKKLFGPVSWDLHAEIDHKDTVTQSINTFNFNSLQSSSQSDFDHTLAWQTSQNPPQRFRSNMADERLRLSRPFWIENRGLSLNMRYLLGNLINWFFHDIREDYIRPKIKIAVVPVTCWLKGRVGR